MTPLCTHCGDPLIPWRALDRVPFGEGAVKDQRLYGCVPCRRMYRVTWTLWRTGVSEHLPTDGEWRRLEHTTPTTHVPVDDDMQLAAAAQLLGPLVDVDRLRLARLVAGWWNTTDGPRSATVAVDALPGLNWRTAGRAIDDAAALGLIDLTARPATKRPRVPGRGRTEAPTVGRYVCDECGYDGRTSRGLGSHRLTHRNVDCDCGWAGTAAEHRAHIRWHCPNRTGGAA